MDVQAILDSGITEFRKGTPLIVPVTATRARVPKAASTLKGMGRKVQEPVGPRPSSRVLNRFTIGFCEGCHRRSPVQPRSLRCSPS